MLATPHWPAFNAALNALAAVLLAFGFAAIRRGNMRRHRALMLSAFTVSVVFLVSYLAYHARAGTVRFQGQGLARTFYFALLLSHTVLAAVVPVLAIVTLSRGLRARYDSHRRIARWTLPIWFYVSVTGVGVYLMLYHLYR